MPTIHCYFENKAAAACATSALNKFCSICTAFRCLHRIWDRPPWEKLFSHHFSIDDYETAIQTSMTDNSMKVIIDPWM